MDRGPSTLPNQQHQFLPPMEGEWYSVTNHSIEQDLGNQSPATLPRQNFQFRHANSLPTTLGLSSKSQSIPIANSIRRTSSDYRLSREADAEYRDFLFYSRVVHGISSKQQHYHDRFLKYENEQSLNNIMRTRYEDSLHPHNQDFHGDDIAQFDSSDPASLERQDEGDIFELEL